MFARVLYQTGILGDVSPKGAVAAVRTLARGAGGPSAIFRVHAAGHPDRVAFKFDGRSFTYAEIDSRIDRLATGLRRRGFRKGDAAVLMLKNRPECIEIGAAMSRIGGAGVAVSWRSTPAELAYVVSNSGARAIFFDVEMWPIVETAHAQCSKVAADALFSVGGTIADKTTTDELMAQAADGELSEQEGAVIIYTSGTTGRPKGAVRNFGSGQLEGFFAFIGETPMRVDDRHLAVCPLYHSTGLGFTGMSLALGATIVILREFEAEEFLRAIDREKITTTAIVPTMLHRLMALPDEVFRRYDLRSLRAVFCGGAQLPSTLAARALDRLGPVLFNFYGATETGLVTVASPDDLRACPGTIGRAVPGAEIRLLGESGREVRMGEVGELYTRNSMLVSGYHGDEAATASSLRDGFFSVGDLATVDSEGRFQIVGRQRDMVISGGVNVYPAEVEAAIETHASVAQVAVIGIADEEWGERLRAFVVRRPGCDVDAPTLRAWCRDRLSGAKVPKEYVFLDALPANPTGKILKRELKSYEGAVEKA